MDKTGRIDFNKFIILKPNEKKEQVNRLCQKLPSPGKTDPQDKKKLAELLCKQPPILLKISTLVLFDWFPDDITIYPNQVVVVTREFFWSGRTHNILIKDITDVVVDSTPFSATMKITDRGYAENVVTIANLNTEEALRAQSIIQGLILAKEKKIDLSKLDISNLAKIMEGIGRSKKPD